MSDIKVDSITHDMVIDINTPVLTEGVETIDQKIKVELLFLFQEWFLDTTQGVPYFQQIAVKVPELAQIEALIREKISSVHGVIEIEQFDLDFDNAQRTLDIDGTVKTTEGIINITLGLPL